MKMVCGFCRPFAPLRVAAAIVMTAGMIEQLTSCIQQVATENTESSKPSPKLSSARSPPDLRYLHAALLTQESTALLARFCQQEDRHLLAQLEQSTLPPPFIAYHSELERRRHAKLRDVYNTDKRESQNDLGQHMFWGRFFTLMWVSREHCL